MDPGQRPPAPGDIPSNLPPVSALSAAPAKPVLRWAHDDFLAQYLQPKKSPHTQHPHHTYFAAINKQRTIKLYDIYRKYLHHTEPAGGRSPLPSTDRPAKHEVPAVPAVSSVPPVADVPVAAKTPREQLPPPSPVSPRETTPVSPADTVEEHDMDVPARTAPAPAQVLPTNFMDCPIDALIVLISRMLTSLISLNDKQAVVTGASGVGGTGGITIENGPSNGSSGPTGSSAAAKPVLTRYHSRTPPSISPHVYLARLAKFNNFNQANLLTTIYYIDLLSHNYQPFFTLNSWTVHRFLLVATMLAQKLLEDFFYTNDHYARVGGVAVHELNCLEMDFLTRVDWRVVPAKILPDGTSTIKHNRNVLELYYSQLIQLMGRYAVTPKDMVYVSDKTSDKNEDQEMEEPKQKYNSNGYSYDGSSSPHLKRRYDEAGVH